MTASSATSQIAGLVARFDRNRDSCRSSAFLKEIESWREALAKNLALRNPGLSQRELNFAVQATIDRLIFLRICEDRGIERYGRLQALQNRTNLYQRLFHLFEEADDRYNSGLFHFKPEKDRPQPDTLTPKLEIDDKILKDILKSLYSPDSPYEFSVLPADILGQVYEQFLGKTIRLTAAHQAKVEDKPEVKKAGGVYYTPTYIVDYIVKNTVGKLLEGRGPTNVSGVKWPRNSAGSGSGKKKKDGTDIPVRQPLRILDPACGSGSFLLGAYQYLLDWFRDQYLNDGPAKHKDKIFQFRVLPDPQPLTVNCVPSTASSWRLTLSERKRILLDHIFGVDIDPSAVEVTKLSLLLKCLEGESEETLNQLKLFFKERALPDLAANIKCGNSLIGSDFFQGKQTAIFDHEEILCINAFDWDKEFSDVFHHRDTESTMNEGGFDVVIGNPPYIFGEYHDKISKDYFRHQFILAKDQYDTYDLFIERALQLTADQGLFSFIVPDALLARDISTGARSMLLNQGLERLYHCGLVFQAGVSACVFTVQKGTQPIDIISEIRNHNDAIIEHSCVIKRFKTEPQNRLLVHASDEEAMILEKIKTKGNLLDKVIRISRGEETGKKHVFEKGPIPILVGDDIKRYYIHKPSRYIDKLSKNKELYKSPKILIVKTGNQCIAGLDTTNVVTMQSVYNVQITNPDIDPKSILGILNSHLAYFIINKTFTAYKYLFPQLNQTTIKSIPIPAELFNNQRPLLEMVARMLELNTKKAAAKVPAEMEAIERQIAATDAEIDRLVYELYNLTEAETRIIESNFKVARSRVAGSAAD